MTTLTLQIDNPSILAQLKKLLKSFHGVKIIDAADTATSSVEAGADVPNALTLAAMNELEAGKDAGTVCMDSIDGFIASMK